VSRCPWQPTAAAQNADFKLRPNDNGLASIEKCTRDGTKVDSLLYAGNSLGRARSVFERAIKHRPRIRPTLRQRMRLLDRWPPPRGT
jgi:hypothetical protein